MTSNKYFIIPLILLAFCAAFIFTIAKRGEPQVEKTNLEKLPMNLAGYIGEEDSFSQDVYDELDADLHVYRHYSANNTQLSLYIGYYGTAKGGRTGHNPYACLPGAGWGIIRQEIVRIYPSYYPKGVDINFVVAMKDGIHNVMLHWYQTSGSKIVSTGLEQNIQRFLGRVLHNRNDGAYIQISSQVMKDDVLPIKNKMTSFAQEIIEFLPNYWPEER